MMYCDFRPLAVCKLIEIDNLSVMKEYDTPPNEAVARNYKLVCNAQCDGNSVICEKYRIRLITMH